MQWLGSRERWWFGSFFALAVFLRLNAIRTVGLTVDAHDYRDLAERFSWSAPWAANWREPGTLAWFKAFGAPFGYPVGAVQAAMFVASMVAFVLWWRIARRRGPLAGFVMCWVLAVAPLLSVDVAGGTRDALGLMMVGVVFLLIDREQMTAAAIVAGSTGLMRFELGVLLLLCVAIVALPRRHWHPVVLGVVAFAAMVGPFMLANGSRYGDVQYASKIHASANRNRELLLRGQPTPEPDLSLPADDIRRHGFFAGELIGWDDYYLDVLGPSLAVERVAEGFLTYSDHLLNQATPTDNGLVRGIVGVVLAGLVVIGATRRDRLALPSLVLVVLGILGYAATFAYQIDTRLMEFTVAPIVLLVVSGSGVVGANAAAGQRRAVHRDLVERPVEVQVDGGVAAGGDRAPVQGRGGPGVGAGAVEDGVDVQLPHAARGLGVDDVMPRTVRD